jgi:hypothetical protein
MTVSTTKAPAVEPSARAPQRSDDVARGPAAQGAIALVGTAVTLVACALVGQRLRADGHRLFTLVPPLTGRFDPRFPIGGLTAAAVGTVLVAALPVWGRRLGWRALLWVGVLAALAWSASLASVDGAAGFLDPVRRAGDYLAALPSVEAPVPFLRRFVETIDVYPTHVRAHPPGLVVGLWWLEKIGLGGAGAIAVLQHAAAASAVPAAMITVRAVSTEAVARRVMPFLVLTPAAVAVGSGDAVFLGVGAWAVAAIVIASGRTGPRAWASALGGGVAFGAGLFLTYGLVPLAAVPLAVLVARRRGTTLSLATAGVAAVTIAFAFAGFFWWDGLEATREQYALSVARSRPYAYYLVANLAAFAVALGPAVVAAIPRLRDRRLWLLVGGGLAAVLLADVSGLSKAEVERIWLPFVPWIGVAAAIYGDRERPMWLAGQVACAIAVQLLVRSLW